MICPECKSIIPDDSIFCPDCGVALNTSPSTNVASSHSQTEVKDNVVKNQANQGKTQEKVSISRENFDKEYEKAAQYYTNEQYEKAFPILQHLAEQDYAPAQSLLGYLYANGSGVPQDMKRAMEWLQKAAEQGDAIAQGNLSSLLQAAGDYEQAVKWLTKAAEQGDANAQYTLGLIYMQGEIVEHSWEDGKKWLLESKKNGMDPATIEELANGIYLSGLHWYQKRAFNAMWILELAGELGNADALFKLGTCYEEGYIMDKDIPQAKSYFTKAAELGHASAKNHLASIDNAGGCLSMIIAVISMTTMFSMFTLCIMIR